MFDKNLCALPVDPFSLRKTLAALGATIVASAVVVSAEVAQDRPNVVVIMADDLGYGDLGCYGAKLVQTPHLDRLAAEGLRLTQAHAPSAVCQPSRYAVMTGLYEWRRGKPWDGSYMFEDNQPTLQRVLGQAGYATAAFGKWHNGWGRGEVDYNKEEVKPGPLESGFDYFFGTPRSHNEPPQVFMENRRMYQPDPDDPLRIIPHKEVVERGLEDWGWGLSEGAAAAHAARPEEEIDLIIARRAADYVRSRPKNKPFMLYIAFVAPHVPLSPAKSFRDTSQAGAYGDFIHQLDHCVGVILEALEEENLQKNTLIFFTSDNGAVYMAEAVVAGHRPNADLLGQKTDAWEGGHAVPLLARWPGHIPAGQTSDALFSLTDILATSLAACGVATPDGAGRDSLNQLPMLEDPRDTPPVRTEMVYTGISGQGLRQDGWVYYPFQGSGGMTAHPTQAWGQPWQRLGLKNSDFTEEGKLKKDAPPGQLYDIAADRSQTTNLYQAHPERVASMEKRLEQLIAPVPAP